MLLSTVSTIEVYLSCVAVNKDWMISFIEDGFESTDDGDIGYYDEGFFISGDWELKELNPC
jgi:hypothetical protein